MVLAALFFSHYKNGTTLKYLIIVTLGGFVIFVSDAYPGKTSDDDILEQNWHLIIQYLPPSVVMLADKGTSLMRFTGLMKEARVDFMVPPRKPVCQVFTAADTALTAAVASQRIVVENVIGRASNFFPAIRDKVSSCLLDLASPITRVAFFLTNLLPPMTQGSSVTNADVDPAASEIKKRRRAAAVQRTARDDELPLSDASTSSTASETSSSDSDDDVGARQTSARERAVRFSEGAAP
jgi:hypothetical protein